MKTSSKTKYLSIALSTITFFIILGMCSTSFADSTINITADNAFELYINGTFIGDGNKWTKLYTYNYDLQEGDVIAVKAVDQGWMAGFIADITWNEKKIYSDYTWRCTNNEYEGWNLKEYDDSSWKPATEHYQYGSGPWGNNVSGLGNTSAKWIWTSDKFSDNEVYFRKTISTTTNEIKVTADNAYTLYVNGSEIGSGNNWKSVKTYEFPLKYGDTIAIEATDYGWIAGLIAEITYNDKTIVTDSTWKCSIYKEDNWSQPGFDDSSWNQAIEHTINSGWPWGKINNISNSAKWIWSGDEFNDNKVYFRKTIGNTIKITADNAYTLYVNGSEIGSGSNWKSVQTYKIPQKDAYVIAIEATDYGWIAGLMTQINIDGTTLFSDNSWKCTTIFQPGWCLPGFDDTSWDQATEHAVNSGWPWGKINGISDYANWIWSSDEFDHNKVYFRLTIGNTSPNTLLVSCLGDSITYGVPYGNGSPYGGPENTYPPKLQGLLDEAYSESYDIITVINHGVGGWRADQVRDKLELKDVIGDPDPGNDWLSFDPEIVLLLVGGNDLKQEFDGSNLFDVVNNTVDEVQEIINLVTDHVNSDGTYPRIIVSTTIPVQDFWETWGVNIYNNNLESNLSGIDLLITTNWVDFYNPATDQADESLMADKYHPNAEGYSVMAENWFEAICGLLDFE